MATNTGPQPSWNDVIACHHPTQPTRYYRGYTLHYPTDSEAKATTTLHGALSNWSAGTSLALSVQYPLLSITDYQTIEITASSPDFDQLLKFDAQFRQSTQEIPKADLAPSTLDLLKALQGASPQAKDQAPTTTLELISGLQASVFDGYDVHSGTAL